MLPADPTHQLYFPHIGDGGLAGTPPRFPQTSLILVNTTRKAVQGRGGSSFTGIRVPPWS